MDLMRNLVGIEVGMCKCGENCDSVGPFLWNCLAYLECRAIFLEQCKNIHLLKIYKSILYWTSKVLHNYVVYKFIELVMFAHCV